MSINDNKFRGYGEQGFTGSITDRERAFLRANPRGTQQEYYTALGVAGFTDISISDREAAYFAANPWVPLGGAAEAPFSAVGFLSGFNGTEGQITFTDESSNANTLSINGGTNVDATFQKFGTGAAFFDGADDGIKIDTADTAPILLTDVDFCLESWVRFFTAPGTGQDTWLSHYNATADQRGWYVQHNNNKLRFAYSTDGTAANETIFETAWTVVNGPWYHVAITRSGSDLRLFQDGVLLSTHDISTDSINTSTGDFWMGFLLDGTGIKQELHGFTDETRITIGFPVYTEAFTPPTEAFPRS